MLLEQGDTTKAHEIFKAGFEKGEVLCAYGMFASEASSYSVSQCTCEKLTSCIEEYKKFSSEDADAAFVLGRCHETGACVTASVEKAKEYYAKAASLGSADAAFNLGCMLANEGKYIDAVPYFEKASSCIPLAKQYLDSLPKTKGD